MTFAGYVRLHFENSGVGKKEKEKTLVERLPFLKYAGTFHLGLNASNNGEIDDALYGSKPL